MPGPEGLSGTRQALAQLSDAGVHAPSRRLRDAAVDRVADERVTEVDEARASGLDEEEVVHEFLQWRGQRLGLLFEDARGDVDDETAPDHGSGLRQGARLRATAARGARGWSCRWCRARRPSRPDRSRPAILLAERPEDLLDVQRDAVRPVVHGTDHVLRRRQAGREQEGRHHPRLGGREPPEPGLLRQPLGQEPRSPLAHRDPRVELVASVGAEREDRDVVDATRERPDDLQAQVVGPVQVLEAEQGGGRDRGQEIGDVVDQLAAPLRRITASGGIGVGPASLESGA